jgi:hypothetical protein
MITQVPALPLLGAMALGCMVFGARPAGAQASPEELCQGRQVSHDDRMAGCSAVVTGDFPR